MEPSLGAWPGAGCRRGTGTGRRASEGGSRTERGEGARILGWGRPAAAAVAGWGTRWRRSLTTAR